MYEGYLQHDAQEVLQCILGYIQEACDTIRREQGLNSDNTTEVKHQEASSVAEPRTSPEDENQGGSKRKSDTEVGNAKKKPKSVDPKKSDAQEEMRNKPVTRSKRRLSTEVMVSAGEAEDTAMKELHKEEGAESEGEGKDGKTSKPLDGKRKKKAKLSWLRPSGKQPSIFSKFRRVGKISCSTLKPQNHPSQEQGLAEAQRREESSEESPAHKMDAHKRRVRCQSMTFYSIIVFITDVSGTDEGLYFGFYLRCYDV